MFGTFKTLLNSPWNSTFKKWFWFTIKVRFICNFLRKIRENDSFNTKSWIDFSCFSGAIFAVDKEVFLIAKRLSSFCFQRHEKILVLLGRRAIAKILQHCQYWRLWKELLHIIWVVKWQVFKYFRPIKANRACQAEVKKHSSSTTDMKAEFLDCRLCMIFHGNCGSLLLTIYRE